MLAAAVRATLHGVPDDAILSLFLAASPMGIAPAAGYRGFLREHIEAAGADHAEICHWLDEQGGYYVPPQPLRPGLGRRPPRCDALDPGLLRRARTLIDQRLSDVLEGGGLHGTIGVGVGACRARS